MKSKRDLEQQLALEERFKERDRMNDKKYAIKLVEQIVFAGLALAATIILSRLLTNGIGILW